MGKIKGEGREIGIFRMYMYRGYGKRESGR
jgi:hypothetical protein